MAELLASALNRRADLVKRYHEVSERILASVTIQEGEAEVEHPNALLTEGKQIAEQLAELISAINHVNASTAVTVAGRRMTLTAALARKGMLAQQRKLLTDAADKAAQVGRHGGYLPRVRATELKTLIRVNVMALRAEADELAAQYREVDLEIQKANFSTELPV